MGYSTSQLRTLYSIQKTTGGISTLCSSYLIFQVVTDSSKRSKTYHRLIAGISFFDAISSLGMFLGTWPMPRDSGMLWASGTDRTCTTQGFFAQFVLGSASYNASLAIYYLLVIKHAWRDKQVQKIEPYLHAVPIIVTLGTATASVFLDILGNAFFWCWIEGVHDAYRWAFFYGPNWAIIFFITIVCCRVWWHVRSTEQKIARYTKAIRANASTASIITSQVSASGLLDRQEQARQRQDARRKKLAAKRDEQWRTRMVARQCFLYAGAFYITWTGATINRIGNAITGKSYYPVLVLVVLTTPILGLPNFIVYLLPKFQQVYRENSRESVWTWIRLTLTRGKADEALDATVFFTAPTSIGTDSMIESAVHNGKHIIELSVVEEAMEQAPNREDDEEGTTPITIETDSMNESAVHSGKHIIIELSVVEEAMEQAPNQEDDEEGSKASF